MTARDGFVGGVHHALGGFKLIMRPGIRLYVVVPLTVNVVVLALALLGVSHVLDYAVEHYFAAWPQWTHWLLWFIFGLLAAIAVFFGFSLLANIIASPFNGMLSEAVERHLTHPGAAMDFAWRRLLREAGRALIAELRKLVYIALRALPLLVLSLIPVVNVLAPAFWFLFGAWMLSVEYLDCPLGNHDRPFPSVLHALHGHRSMALGFGGCMTLLTVLPLVNFLAMPVGVAGATSMYCAHFVDRNHRT